MAGRLEEKRLSTEVINENNPLAELEWNDEKYREVIQRHLETLKDSCTFSTISSIVKTIQKTNSPDAQIRMITRLFLIAIRYSPLKEQLLGNREILELLFKAGLNPNVRCAASKDFYLTYYGRNEFTFREWRTRDENETASEPENIDPLTYKGPPLILNLAGLFYEWFSYKNLIGNQKTRYLPYDSVRKQIELCLEQKSFSMQSLSDQFYRVNIIQLIAAMGGSCHPAIPVIINNIIYLLKTGKVSLNDVLKFSETFKVTAPSAYPHFSRGDNTSYSPMVLKSFPYLIDAIASEIKDSRQKKIECIVAKTKFPPPLAKLVSEYSEDAVTYPTYEGDEKECYQIQYLYFTFRELISRIRQQEGGRKIDETIMPVLQGAIKTHDILVNFVSNPSIQNLVAPLIEPLKQSIPILKSLCTITALFPPARVAWFQQWEKENQREISLLMGGFKPSVDLDPSRGAGPR